MSKVAGFLDRIGPYAGLVALLMGCVSIGSTIWQNVDSVRSTSCQYRINQEFLGTLQQRAKIGNENTDNINGLIKGVFSTKDPKTALKDYQDYLTELETINGELSKATYPSFHSC